METNGLELAMLGSEGIRVSVCARGCVRAWVCVCVSACLRGCACAWVRVCVGACVVYTHGRGNQQTGAACAQWAQMGRAQWARPGPVANFCPTTVRITHDVKIH